MSKKLMTINDHETISLDNEENYHAWNEIISFNKDERSKTDNNEDINSQLIYLSLLIFDS